jgi:hypothetical protein
MTTFVPGTNKDYMNAFNKWWANGAQGEAPDRSKFGKDTPDQYKPHKWQKYEAEEMGTGDKGQLDIKNGWQDFYNKQRDEKSQKIGGGEITEGLTGSGYAPGYGGSIDSGFQGRTADFQDKDRDGIDDRDQAGPGQAHWKNKQSKNAKSKPAKSWKGNQKSSDWLSFGNQVLDDATSGKTEKPDFGDYKPGTASGNLYNQGWGNMVDWGNKFKDNETIQGFISGSRLDSNRTMMNMGLDLLYQKGQMSNMAQYQGGMENLKTGNTLKLLAAEGGIVGQLTDQAGNIKSRQIRETGAEDRKGLRVAGQENRAGTRETGSQDRLTQRDKYREERKMRADARGAVRRSGSRFFG